MIEKFVSFFISLHIVRTRIFSQNIALQILYYSKQSAIYAVQFSQEKKKRSQTQLCIAIIIIYCVFASLTFSVQFTFICDF